MNNNQIEVPVLQQNIAPSKKEEQSKKDYDREHKLRLATISEELEISTQFVKKYMHEKIVAILVSARIKKGSKYYLMIEDLAAKLSSDGWIIVIGGGPGGMEAAGRGVHRSNGRKMCIGRGIKLPHEQEMNTFVTHGYNHKYFFTRKFAMTCFVKGFIYGPGGLGTHDELFEVATLIQTEKMPSYPMFLFGKKYWTPYYHVWKKTMLQENQFIDHEDLERFIITNNNKTIIKTLNKNYQRLHL